jgi:hypothetical protein
MKILKQLKIFIHIIVLAIMVVLALAMSSMDPHPGFDFKFAAGMVGISAMVHLVSLYDHLR